MTAVLLIALNFDFFNLKAQSPEMMSYQAVIRDATGNLVRDKQVRIRISILQGEIDGNSVFIEEHQTTTNENGLVSIVIGSGQPYYAGAELKSSAPDDDAVSVYGEFSDISWDEGPYFIKVETDPEGGTNYTITGVSQLLSVPYALYAKNASNTKFKDGTNADDAVYTKGNVGIGTNTPLGRLDISTGGWDHPLVISHPTLGHTDVIQASDGLLFKNSHAINDKIAYSFRDSSDTHIMDIVSNGNVGIGTELPESPLHISTDSVPALIIQSKTTNNPDRPGIQFKNNTSHFISGDGLSDEYFGFYSNWSNTREFDAKLRVFGKADQSWGKYLEMTHDGTNGTIRTDAGDIKLQPEENIDAASNRITNVATPVDAQDAVTKEYVDNLLLGLGLYTFKDIDGNTYKAVKIGDQVWMAENLRVTHYPNGEEILNVPDYTAWSYLQSNNTADAYCYNYTDKTNKYYYGLLYTYAAAIAHNWEKDNKEGQGICPDGWHLPTYEEWITLRDYLGGANIAGGKMKANSPFWDAPNEGATNESGFSALPGGHRKDDGEFYGLGTTAGWWSSTEYEYDHLEAWVFEVSTNNTDLGRGGAKKSMGVSVRCVKD